MNTINNDEIAVSYSNRKNISALMWGIIALGLMICNDQKEIIESDYLLILLLFLFCFIIYAEINFYRKLYVGEPAFIFNNQGFSIPGKPKQIIKWDEIHSAIIVSKRRYEFVLVRLKNDKEYLEKNGISARFNKLFYDVPIVLSDSHVEISNKEILDNILKYIEKYGYKK